MVNKYFLILAFGFFMIHLAAFVHAQTIVLDNNMHHLRDGSAQEWTEFPKKASSSSLNLQFTSRANSSNFTLKLRQYDINRQWLVKLNGQNLGSLTLDEKDMNSYFDIAPGLLLNGQNELSVVPAKPLAMSSSEMADDIRISEIAIISEPLKNHLNSCVTEISIMDAGTKKLVPSKLTITDMKGSLQTLGSDEDFQHAIRTGIIYTANGQASVKLPPGKYKIYAGRGIEFSVDSSLIDIKKGDHLRKTFRIRREIPTEGWVSSDTHIHSLTYSGHGDASISERALTLAGEGIELPVITEHNKNITIAAAASLTSTDKYFTPIMGNEVTTTVGHFNIFPIVDSAQVPQSQVANWDSLSATIAAASAPRAIILNHARDIHNGFIPHDAKRHVAIAGLRLDDWKWPANAMEVLNSGSQQTDINQLYHDWFGLLNHGFKITPVGSSDSHDVNRFIVGQGRTYIRCADDSDPSRLNIDEAIGNFVNGKVMVSFGLLTKMTVNESYGPGDMVPYADKFRISIEVWGPGWLKANNIALYANGKVLHSTPIVNKSNSPLKWKGTWVLEQPLHDLYLVAVANGPGGHLPFWPVAKPFQHTSPEWTPKILGLTGAIWIDGDNDGIASSAYAYAKKLVVQSSQNSERLITELASYHESVAIQAAAILYKQGEDLSSAKWKQALIKASPAVKRSFDTFVKALRH